MLVLVTNGDQHRLIKVNTTTHPEQARWDAYCYCLQDPSPTPREVEENTQILEPQELNDIAEAFRDPRD